MEPNRSTDSRFDHLFKNLNDAVVEFVLVDGEPKILGINDAFCEVFGYDRESVNGESLNKLIVPPSKLEEAYQLDQRTGIGKSNAAVVERMTNEGKRTFLYRGVPYKDRYGFAIYSDITDEMQQKRHLDVLHRVLRHNLRNELTIIGGMADLICDQTDENKTREAATKIKDAASRLSNLSDEAQTIRQVLGEVASVRSIRLLPLAESVIEDCEDRFESAEITTDVSTGITVSANEKIKIALQSILDNAIRHNDSSDPQVHLSATICDSDTVEVTVVDNGPGIPKTQQQIITEDAEITSLKHGSGLGLWLSKWIVEACDGRIEIETPEGGGSTVSFYLNAADATSH